MPLLYEQLLFPIQTKPGTEGTARDRTTTLPTDTDGQTRGRETTEGRTEIERGTTEIGAHRNRKNEAVLMIGEEGMF